MVLGLIGVLTVMVGCSKTKVDVVDFGEGVKLEMVLVPVGKFKMGFTKKEMEDFKVAYLEVYKNFLGNPAFEIHDWLDDWVVNGTMRNQGNQHEVTLTKPFYMGKYEVTQEQWQAVMGNNPSATKGAKLPVTNVSWEDCQEFITKLNAKTNGVYRLPSESEWEYACRAGTTTAYSFGDKITPKDANYDNSLKGKLVAVGSYKPNAFGLYDMHGNVDEWCEDWHGEYPFAATDPKGPATGEIKVMRGGSFNGYGLLTHSSHRETEFPIHKVEGFGFRLAKDK